MNTYEFVELVEHPDQGDYIPPEVEDLKYWQFDLVQELGLEDIDRELELQNIIEDVLAA